MRVRYTALCALAILAAGCRAGGPPPATGPAPVPVTNASRPSTLPDSTYLKGRALMVPVVGAVPAKLYDSFYEKREGGRIHHAVDIMAPKGTPVLAADDGRVLRMRTNHLGGTTIYAVDAGERFVFYYAHLSRYADGLSEGKIVSKGEIIGYVGSTGDAKRDAPHLHFQIMKRPANGRWWDGKPIDPVPYLMLPGVLRAP